MGSRANPSRIEATGDASESYTSHVIISTHVIEIQLGRNIDTCLGVEEL